mgnify:CR=1 FL=1
MRLTGIDKDDLMQNQPSHFRKKWPEGVVDNGEGDGELYDFLEENKKKKPEPVITYPWSLAEEAVHSQKSLEWAESHYNHKLSEESVKDGGMGMIFHYDND